MWRWINIKQGGKRTQNKEIQAFLYLQAPSTDDSKTKDKKKKPSAKQIELPLDVKTHGYGLDALHSYQDQEVSSVNHSFVCIEFGIIFNFTSKLPKQFFEFVSIFQTYSVNNRSFLI